MTTVFVDLVNLDGSRPEGTLRFSLERLVLGDPDVVPSAVEVKIRDGRARVEGLLPGAMRVRVNAGCWSKDWEVSIPAEGEHDLFELLEWQAEDFQETVWAALAKRVEALENTPAVDLAPLEQRIDALEAKPAPQPVDLAPLEETTRQLDNRVTALEGKPAPAPFDPTELQQQLADMQAKLATMPNFTPVDLLAQDTDEFYEATETLWEISPIPSASLWMGRVNIKIPITITDRALEVLRDGLHLPIFPTPLNDHIEMHVTVKSDNTVWEPSGDFLTIYWLKGGLFIQDQGTNGESNVRKELQPGENQIRIEVEYFTTDTN